MEFLNIPPLAPDSESGSEDSEDESEPPDLPGLIPDPDGSSSDSDSEVGEFDVEGGYSTQLRRFNESVSAAYECAVDAFGQGHIDIEEFIEALELLLDLFREDETGNRLT